MRKTKLGSLLAAILVACVGCSSEDGGAAGSGGGAGTGGTGGPVTALSFDAETALPASAGAAVAVAFGTQFGALMSSLGAFGGLGPRSVQGAVAPKDVFPLPGLCPDGGSASIDWSGALVSGETLIVTLQDCEGVPLLSGPTNGTITFEVDRAEGLVFVGAATLHDLQSPDAVIAGSFSVRTNMANLFLGCGLGTVPDCEPATENIVATQGGQQLRLECFEIYQRYPEFFRPLAVATLGNEVYTINDYQSTPDNITFVDGVPVRGTIELLSGVGPGAGGPETPCPMESGDGSSCELSFNADGCVDINCTTAEAGSIVRSAPWDELLSFDLSGASEEPCGTGGGGGTGGQGP